MIDFLKDNDVKYVSVDTDGDSELLIPLLMEAGVDIICHWKELPEWILLN